MSTELFIWYWGSSILLAIVIFRPVKKFILAQRINKAERKLKRQLTDEERKVIEKKTIPMTAFIVLTFSLLFNRILIGKFYLSQ